MSFMFLLRSWNRSVSCGCAMGWTVQGSIPGSDSDFYLQIIHTVSGTNQASNLGRTDGCSLELIYEVDNSHPCTAKDKNG